MVMKQWPTFGEMLDYLRQLGYSFRTTRPGYLACELPQADSIFVFRERESTEPAREGELLELRVQLTYRGLATDEEFAQFWMQGMPRPSHEHHPVAPAP